MTNTGLNHPAWQSHPPAGLLGLPEADMHRKAKAESQTLQERWAREFRAEFDAFDWTKMLD